MPKSRKFLILSVDDEPEVAVLLKRSSQIGFPEAKVISVLSIEALSEYLQNPDNQLPQLILLDLNMPDGETGFTLLKSLRQNSSLNLIPIIILSVSDSDLYIKEAYFQGANAYMTKPESYEGWIRIMGLLKVFWQQTATIPRLE